LLGLPASGSNAYDISFTLQPNANAVSPPSSIISITVTDRFDNTIVTTNFDFTVNIQNDPPTITSIPSPQSVQSGGSTTNIAFTVADPDSATLIVTGTSSDQALVRNANIVVNIPSGAPGARTVRISAEPNVVSNSPVTITLVVADGTSGDIKRATNSFVLNVRPSRERIFSNSTLVTIRDNTTAQAYPSLINVSGLAGSVAQVEATLNGFTHRFPDDVDVLLVSPGGQKVILLSDAGGGVAVTNLNLAFEDAASGPVGDAGPLSSTSFQPSNYEGTTTDNFVAPAPGGPYASAMNAFNGVSPNGDWSLYVIDDTPSDSGAISNGWTLSITTQPMIVGLTDVTSEEDVVARVGFTIAEESFAAQGGFTLSATSTNLAVVNTNGVTFTGSGTNWTAVVTPVANAAGTTEITVTVVNADGQSVNGKFRATFTPVNDTPTITTVADQTINAGGATPPITFDYSDIETEKKDLVLGIQSSDPAVIPVNHVKVVGTVLTISSFGSQSGTSQITLTATDLNGASNSTSFAVVVLPSPNPLFASTGNITVRDNNSADPYPSTITVSNVFGTVSKVTVTLVDVTHTFPDDVDILLVGPQGQKVVLMSDAGGSTALTNVRLTFDDAATPSVPDNSAITSGSYKPSNYEGTDVFAAPAPAGPYAAALSAFSGVDPNGTWSLFVQDDAAPDAGLMTEGWLLSIVTTSPQISGLPISLQLLEDASTNLSFTVSDADTAVSNLVTSASTSNTNLLGVSISGTNATRTLAVVTVPNAFGSNATVTVTVTDGSSTNQTSFTVNVAAVNDAPTIAGLSNTNTPSNRPLSIDFTVADVETAASNLTVAASVSTTNLGTVAVSGNTGNRTLTYTPVSGATGTNTVEVTVSDGGITTTNTFLVNVTAVVGPTISAIANQTTNEDTALAVPFQVTSATFSNLTVTGSASNTNLVSGVVITGTNGNRTATINLRTNAFGTSTITITATDPSGSATNSFQLTVNSVDDAPVLAAISDQTTTAGQPVVVPLGVSDVDTPLTNLTFSATTSNPNVVSGVTFAVTPSSATATINTVSNGVSTVTITVRDSTNTVSRAFAVQVVVIPRPTLSVTIISNLVRITLNGVAGVSYVLESADVVTGPWTALSIGTADASGQVQFTVNTTGAPRRFFRGRTGNVAIASVVETGGDNEATDTITAKWTGASFLTGIANEPLNNTPTNTLFTVGFFVEEAPCYVDRNHQWNGATTNLAIPAYLLGGEYIMSGNDNRDNASYRLDITLSRAANVYMLIDNRTGDANAGNPPNFTTNMTWIVTNGWLAVQTGLNRSNNVAIPDEVGVDEGGNGIGPGGDIQNWNSIYVKSYPAGTFSIFQADNAGQNMYGVVVKPTP
jgi:subtilisin-like proprotein convertase family protein